MSKADLFNQVTGDPFHDLRERIQTLSEKGRGEAQSVFDVSRQRLDDVTRDLQERRPSELAEERSKAALKHRAAQYVPRWAITTLSKKEIEKKAAEGVNARHAAEREIRQRPIIEETRQQIESIVELDRRSEKLEAEFAAVKGEPVKPSEKPSEETVNAAAPAAEPPSERKAEPQQTAEEEKGSAWSPEQLAALRSITAARSAERGKAPQQDTVQEAHPAGAEAAPAASAPEATPQQTAEEGKDSAWSPAQLAALHGIKAAHDAERINAIFNDRAG